MNWFRLFLRFYWLLVLNLARRDPHDVDGVADDISGALLALGSLGHGASIDARKFLATRCYGRDGLGRSRPQGS